MSDVRFGDKRLPMAFWRHVTRTRGGCWIWTGAILKSGYGSARLGNATGTPHRFAYLALVGAPSGKRTTLHHACKNRLCVNPTHLRLVSKREHQLRHGAVGRANMLAVRLTDAEAEQFDLICSAAGDNRSTTLRKLIRRAARELSAPEPAPGSDGAPVPFLEP